MTDISQLSTLIWHSQVDGAVQGELRRQFVRSGSICMCYTGSDCSLQDLLPEQIYLVRLQRWCAPQLSKGAERKGTAVGLARDHAYRDFSSH